MHPATIRDALQRLSELQLLQDHLPPNVALHRMGELAELIVRFIKDRPDAFQEGRALEKRVTQAETIRNEEPPRGRKEEDRDR